jgi:protoporphyrinogen oxidase
MPDHWMYLPGRELTVHRLSEFKNFSPDAAPAGSTAVCCEITCRVGDERWRLDDAGAGALALADLERIGLLSPGEGRLLDVARLPRAYPVYDHAYRGRLELLRAALRRVGGLTSTGRQGLFRYNNMDHSIAMGRKAARALGAADEPAPALPAGVAGAEVAAAAADFG